MFASCLHGRGLDTALKAASLLWHVGHAGTGAAAAHSTPSDPLHLHSPRHTSIVTCSKGARAFLPSPRAKPLRLRAASAEKTRGLGGGQPLRAG